MPSPFTPATSREWRLAYKIWIAALREKYIRNGILWTTAQLNHVEKAQVHYGNKLRAPFEKYLFSDVFLSIAQTFWSLWRQVSKLGR